jgi:hypothetical protein
MLKVCEMFIEQIMKILKEILFGKMRKNLLIFSKFPTNFT